jgi:hypothetical protein
MAPVAEASERDAGNCAVNVILGHYRLAYGFRIWLVPLDGLEGSVGTEQWNNRLKFSIWTRSSRGIGWAVTFHSKKESSSKNTCKRFCKNGNR